MIRSQTLHDLRALRLRMSVEDRALLDESAAWPAIVIEDSAQVVGFLMAPAAQRYFHDFGRAGLKPLELQYLLFEKKAAWGNLRIPHADERLALCVHAASLVDVLHKYGAVLGDISMTNVLWTLEPSPTTFLIDCDGVHPGSSPPVLPVTNTPHWVDPDDPHHATISTDRYKLAQLVIRVLAGDPYVEPSGGLPATPGVSSRTRTSISRLLSGIERSSKARPAASEWIGVLSA